MSDLPFTLDQLKILHAISHEGSFKKAAGARVLSTWARQLVPDRRRQITDGPQRLHIYDGFSTARHIPS